jgi:hypothetical protein
VSTNAKPSRSVVKVTPQKAKRAAKAAKVVFAKRKTAPSDAWKKGGKEYSKVLGHFGLTDSSK